VARLDDFTRAQAALLESGSAARSSDSRDSLPSFDAVVELLQDARMLLLPHTLPGEERARPRLEERLARFLVALAEQVERALEAREPGTAPSAELHEQALEVARRFVARMPELQRTLWIDAQAAYDGDPSLYSLDEAFLCYPGVLAVTGYRIAHLLHTLDVPLIPRLMTERAHSLTGIDIHPGAIIGERFFIDHGTGVVIGETSEIGNGVRMYQGVTLGAKKFTLTPAGHLEKGVPRHPIVEDDVVIYSGASVLGRITIGRGAIIGGNVWVTNDVPPGGVVTQAEVRQTRFSHGGGI
jgi:serine O-acetyltransferase